MNVLLVEDSKDIREIYKEAFTECGCQVFEAENGQEALNFLVKQSTQIDIIITDVQMPVMNGFDFLKLVRQKYKDKPPVVILTGGCPYSKFQFLQEGAVSYLDKADTDIDELVVQCRRIVGR